MTHETKEKRKVVTVINFARAQTLNKDQNYSIHDH